MTSTTVPLSINLDEKLRDKLNAIAIRQQRTPDALATEAIYQLIQQQERELAWDDSCDAALKHCDETGLHATHDEVTTWMNSWGTKDELAAPVCHL